MHSGKWLLLLLANIYCVLTMCQALCRGILCIASLSPHCDSVEKYCYHPHWLHGETASSGTCPRSPRQGAQDWNLNPYTQIQNPGSFHLNTHNPSGSCPGKRATQVGWLTGMQMSKKGKMRSTNGAQASPLYSQHPFWPLRSSTRQTLVSIWQTNARSSERSANLQRHQTRRWDLIPGLFGSKVHIVPTGHGRNWPVFTWWVTKNIKVGLNWSAFNCPFQILVSCWGQKMQCLSGYCVPFPCDLEGGELLIMTSQSKCNWISISFRAERE